MVVCSKLWAPPLSRVPEVGLSEEGGHLGGGVLKGQELKKVFLGGGGITKNE